MTLCRKSKSKNQTFASSKLIFLRNRSHTWDHGTKNIRNDNEGRMVVLQPVVFMYSLALRIPICLGVLNLVNFVDEIFLYFVGNNTNLKGLPHDQDI